MTGHCDPVGWEDLCGRCCCKTSRCPRSCFCPGAPPSSGALWRMALRQAPGSRRWSASGSRGSSRAAQTRWLWWSPRWAQCVCGLSLDRKQVLWHLKSTEERSFAEETRKLLFPDSCDLYNVQKGKHICTLTFQEVMSFHSRHYVYGTVHHFYNKRIIIQLALWAFPVNLDIVQTENTPHRNPTILWELPQMAKKLTCSHEAGCWAKHFMKLQWVHLSRLQVYTMYNTRVTWFYHIIPCGISIIRETSANAAVVAVVLVEIDLLKHTSNSLSGYTVISQFTLFSCRYVLKTQQLILRVTKVGFSRFLTLRIGLLRFIYAKG